MPENIQTEKLAEIKIILFLVFCCCVCFLVLFVPSAFEIVGTNWIVIVET